VEKTVPSSYNVAWRHFAEEVGARHFIGDRQKPEQIIARIAPWNVTLTLDGTGNTTRTRLVAPYICIDNFTFLIERVTTVQSTGFDWSEIPSLVAIVQNGTYIDREFRVVTNSPERSSKLLVNDALRNYLLSEPTIRMEAGRVTGQEYMTHLACQVNGMVGTKDRLLSLFELMAETLQQLRELGSALDKDPLPPVI
jgi:hypothetical protein